MLRLAFADSASNAAEFKRKALSGGDRVDEGLDSLLPVDWTQPEKLRALKAGMVDWLDRGGIPNRNVKSGDREMQIDPVVIHECRLSLAGVDVLVQVELLSDDPGDPAAKVHSVKRAY